jgi:hypothetical protein
MSTKLSRKEQRQHMAALQAKYPNARWSMCGPRETWKQEESWTQLEALLAETSADYERRKQGGFAGEPNPVVDG